jgi:hypothetical protein
MVGWMYDLFTAFDFALFLSIPLLFSKRMHWWPFLVVLIHGGHSERHFVFG